MKQFLLFFLLFAATTAVQAADKPQIDEALDMVVNRDLPYVPLKIDKTREELQTLDIYRKSEGGSAPVILYIHGGGWAFGDKADVHVKPQFFTRQGFAFVSMNYRLRWDYKVYDQLTDVVTAISWIQENGDTYGLDGDRIVLMGHAAGGHLASLVATDRSFLGAENIDPASLRAIVSIDSNSYDIPLLINELGNFIERRQHELIFTADADVWAAASPISHVSKNKALPAFALLYNPEHTVSSEQARTFAKALSAGKAQVIMIPGSEVAPDQTDELLGTSGHVPTSALMAFLRSQI